MPITGINTNLSNLALNVEQPNQSSLKSDGSILNIVNDIAGTTSNSSALQAINVSTYYKKLNALGIETSSDFERTEETDTKDNTKTQDSLNNALKNKKLTPGQIADLNKAKMAYDANSNAITTTFEIAV